MGGAVLFSDLHGHNWSEFGNLVTPTDIDWPYPVNSRLLDAAMVLEGIRAFCKAHSVSYVFMLGDLFHRKRMVDVSVQNIIARGIWNIASDVERVFLLAGNHDQASRIPIEHSLYALAGDDPRIQVVDEPGTFDVGGARIGLVPYFDRREDVLAGVDAVKGADWLGMHVGAQGARVGALEYRPKEAISALELPAKRIFSGHYHYPQTLPTRKDGEFVYLGSPLEHDRGDGNHGERGFVYIPDVVHPNWERVPIRGPQFVSVATDTDKRDWPVFAGNFVDIKVMDSSHDVDALVNVVRKEARGFRVVPSYVPKSKTARLKVAKSGKTRLPSIGEMCIAYAKQLGDDYLDEGKLIDIAQRALQAASEEEVA